MSDGRSEVCRIRVGDDVGVGVRRGTRLLKLDRVRVMAELLALPLDDIRRLVDAAVEADVAVDGADVLAPVDEQEVWAAGVTYERSREARVAESGRADIYTRVYDAGRPELFLKATARRVVRPGAPARLRSDSSWDACEPELLAVANSNGEIIGFGIGDDVCSRSIEAENPLYLPQAKVYDDSCVLSVGWVPAWEWQPTDRSIRFMLRRGDHLVWSAETSTARMRRSPQELVAWLYRELRFPSGVFLLTGTGIVPPEDVVFEDGDEIEISIDGLGVLKHRLYREHDRREFVAAALAATAKEEGNE